MRAYILKEKLEELTVVLKIVKPMIGEPGWLLPKPSELEYQNNELKRALLKYIGVCVCAHVCDMRMCSHFCCELCVKEARGVHE